MNTFHLILQRSIVCFFVLCFAFVSIYIPQSWNDVKTAEAGGAATGGATLPMQVVQNASALAGNISTSASAVFDGITSFATNSLWIKEVVLDGIGWMLAKQIISQMTASIVRWINSGFQGSPAFVQDLEGFLLNIGDQVIGQYISELGGPLSFICSPFQLDIRIALATTYARTREGQPAAPACTLTGALANIENFMAGSFDDGGWDAWLQITSSPETLTPYGSLLTAQSEASIRIVNAQKNETKILDFGSGFLSSQICSAVHGSGTTQNNCFISTPGKVIQEALTFQLSTGPRSLIEADEINEIIGALISQVAQQAITGAAGLLGLSSGTGYTTPGYTGGSFVDQMSSSASTLTINPAQFRALAVAARTTEISYQTAATYYQPLLAAYAANILNDSARRADAQAAATAIPPLLVSINSNINTLNNIINQYDALPAPSADTPATSVQRSALIQQYTSIQANLHSDAQVTAEQNRWNFLIQ